MSCVSNYVSTAVVQSSWWNYWKWKRVKSLSAFGSLLPKMRAEVPTCTWILRGGGGVESEGIKRTQYWQQHFVANVLQTSKCQDFNICWTGLSMHPNFLIGFSLVQEEFLLLRGKRQDFWPLPWPSFSSTCLEGGQRSHRRKKGIKLSVEGQMRAGT